jgi:hypothetical protein
MQAIKSLSFMPCNISAIMENPLGDMIDSGYLPCFDSLSLPFLLWNHEAAECFIPRPVPKEGFEPSRA